MRSLWRAIVRTVFWSYERGTWPYDVMVVVIVLFVLVTPRKWFHDQPQPGLPLTVSVQLVSNDPASQVSTYRLDASALEPQKRATKQTPELERETHDLLGRTVVDLKDRTFHVLRIEPVFSDNGSVLYYDISVHP